MRRVVAAIGAAAVIAGLALTMPAAATHTNQTDPNDTRGPLDARAVRFTHGDAPRWQVQTFARWSVSEMWDHGYLVVQLDTRADEAIDHLIVVRSDGRDLLATLYRVRTDGRQIALGPVDSDKAGGRGAWVQVALHKLTIGSDRTSYSWTVLTSFTGGGCPHTCLDRVPDSGPVEQLLPGVTPSPTPSATPSPTTTPSPSPSSSP
jgi:hypothetical protein